MKRIMTAVALSACFLTTTGCETLLGPSELQPPIPENPSALSPPYDMMIAGEPNLTMITVKGGYYIWKVGNSWHLRVARTDLQPRTVPQDFFAGSISVEGGYIANVEQQNVQPPDDMRPEPNAISFSFEVLGEVKGVDFAVRPTTSEYCISFDLLTNDFANPAYVRLGSGMVVPDAMPVKMCFRRPF
jgi:hypothetical protein